MITLFDAAAAMLPCRRPVALTLAVVAQVTSMPALAQVNRTGMDVAASGDIATNPFLEVGDARTAGSATLEVQPWWLHESETSNFDLRGLVQVRQYTKFHGLEDNYSLNARLDDRVSPRLSLRGTGSVSYLLTHTSGLATFGGGSPLGEAEAGVPPVVSDPLLVEDPTLFGQRNRVFTATIGSGATYRANEFEQIDVDVGARVVRHKNAAHQDYLSATQELGYQRVLDDQSSIGAILSIGETDYRRRTEGDSITVSPLVAAIHRFTPRLTLDLAAGASFSRVKRQLPLDDARSTSLALRGSLCSKSDQVGLCVEARRSPQPSANGGLRNSTSLRATFEGRVAEFDRIGASVSYTRSSQIEQDIGPAVPTVEFGSAALRYERTFRQNLVGFVTASYTDLQRRDFEMPANLAMSVGLRIALGDRR